MTHLKTAISWTILAALAGIGLPLLQAQTVSISALTPPRRMLVVYRDGTIPADADSATLRAGGKMLHKHARFGTAVVSGSTASEAALRLDPNVEFVVEDRPVTASQLQVRPTDANQVNAPVARATAPTLAMPSDGPDAFYANSPQGWAVRAVAVVASTNPDCAEDLAAGDTCSPGLITLPYYSNYGAPLNAVAAPGGSYPQGGNDAVSGWVRGACSTGLPNTATGLPTDSTHSMGCFNLGHAPYMQAIGTSASAPLVAGVVAIVKAAHPDWDAPTIVAAVRASAVRTASMPYGVVNAVSALTYKP